MEYVHKNISREFVLPFHFLEQELNARTQRSSFQQTLSRKVILSGVGLHSAKNVILCLLPANENHGIRFVRTDLSNGARYIIPSTDSVSQTELCTTFSNDSGGYVRTVEHLLAALHATGLTNVLIEINGPEIPIMDGSSAPFVKAIFDAGLTFQNARQTYLKVKKDVFVTKGNKRACIKSHEDPLDSRFLVDFTIDFTDSCIGKQSCQLDINIDTFVKEVCAARTFGFADQLDSLRRRGFAQGGDLSNAILVDHGTIQNPDGLRFDQEFVRHKALDAIGDMFVEGLPLIGRYEGIGSGHELTNLAMRALMRNPSNFDLVEI